MEFLVMCMVFLPIVSLTRHELESGGSRVRTDNAADDAFRVSVVLRTVGGVDLAVHVVRFDEENVLAEAAGFDVSFVAHLGVAEPWGRASVDGADVEVVVLANDPDRHQVP